MGRVVSRMNIIKLINRITEELFKQGIIANQCKMSVDTYAAFEEECVRFCAFITNAERIVTYNTNVGIPLHITVEPADTVQFPIFIYPYYGYLHGSLLPFDVVMQPYQQTSLAWYAMRINGKVLDINRKYMEGADIQ